MTCPVCGKEPPCTHGRSSTVLLAGSDQPEAKSGHALPSDSAAQHHWRDEVTSRIQQHRARRRGCRSNEAAMEFDFPPAEALAVTEEPVVRYRIKSRAGRDAGDDVQTDSFDQADPKILRFPRTFAAAVSSPYWRAEEVLPDPEPPAEPEPAEAELSPEPRMVEVSEPVAPAPEPMRAEQLDLLPNFEDIRLEPAHSSAVIAPEIIPQPASLQQRAIAGIIDVGIVAIAASVFDFTFLRLSEDDPHSRIALLCGVGVTAILWILFQYLFLVHGRGTPGMRFAELELATFEGKPVTSNARRCRALASMLSAFSIGLGYGWAFIDEDQLGWHDRITGTLVRPAGTQPVQPNEIWG